MILSDPNHPFLHFWVFLHVSGMAQASREILYTGASVTLWMTNWNCPHIGVVRVTWPISDLWGPHCSFGMGEIRL